MNIKIDGANHNVVAISKQSVYLPVITTAEGVDFYIAESSESAGEAAKKYWEDMINNDKEEFITLMGHSRMVEWAFNGGLQGWLDAQIEIPEQWAISDGTEQDVGWCDEELIEELGFTPKTAYRWN